MKMLVVLSLTVFTFCLSHQDTYAQTAPNTITFENQSGEFAIVKLMGPTKVAVEVPNGQEQTVHVEAGNYYLLGRYGTRPEEYTYTKGAPFKVTQPTGQYSAITITLHKVVQGNYHAKPVSGNEFKNTLIEDPRKIKQSEATENKEKKKEYSNKTAEGIGTLSIHEVGRKGSLKESPKVLIRTLQTGYLAYDGLNFLFELRTQRHNSNLKGKLTTLQSECQVHLQEDLQQNIEVYSRPLFKKGAWGKPQELFDFVVTLKLDVYEREKQKFNSPLELIMDETWEIYKVENPNLKQTWEAYYNLQTDYIAHHSDIITLKAQKMLKDVIEPKRGPILRNICAFIHEHFNTETSGNSK